MHLIDIKRKASLVLDIAFNIAIKLGAIILVCVGVYKLTRWFLS